MNLLRAEWSRLFHRRVTLVLGGASLVVLAVMVLGFGATSRPPTESELRSARVDLAQAQQFYAEQRAQCAAASRAAGGGFEQKCANESGPRPRLDDYLPYRFSFRRQIEQLLALSTLVLAIVGFILGASFLGAEWSSGGMTNLLLWRPRREAVLGAKLAVVVGGVLAIAASYLVVWIGAFWLLGALIGTADGVSAGMAASIGLLALRIVALTALLALGGATLATLGRRTAAAMGVAMAYAVAYELGTLIIFSLLHSEFSGRFRLSTYVGALLIKRIELYDSVTNNIHIVTWVEGAAVLTVVAAALTGAAFAAVRTRDVT